MGFSVRKKILIFILILIIILIIYKLNRIENMKSIYKIINYVPIYNEIELNNGLYNYSFNIFKVIIIYDFNKFQRELTRINSILNLEYENKEISTNDYELYKYAISKRKSKIIDKIVKFKSKNDFDIYIKNNSIQIKKNLYDIYFRNIYNSQYINLHSAYTESSEKFEPEIISENNNQIFKLKGKSNIIMFNNKDLFQKTKIDLSDILNISTKINKPILITK
jgi:hypothetical protein